MIVDSSALLAVILGESDSERFALATADDPAPLMPAPIWLEVALVIDGRAEERLRDRFDAYATRLGLTVVPFLPNHAAQARLAWHRFGRGRHAAKLNYGDCVSYGFARVEGQPLLFKGNDFALTDIEPALKD